VSDVDNQLVTGTSTAQEPEAKPEQVEVSADTDNGKKPEDNADKPKKDGAQKRIDRLTREKYQLKAELDVIKRQLDGGKTHSNGVDRNSFDSDQDYIEAVVEQRLAERESKREAERFARKRDEIFSQAEKLGDFDREDFASVPITSVMAEVIMESEIAAKLVVYLNDNPEEAEKIASMSGSRQAAALGKIETRLEGEDSKPKAASKSAAPEPIKPVSASKSSTGFRLGMSQAEYRALRAKTTR